MLKKRYNIQKQLFIKYNYKQLFFDKILETSLKVNKYIYPIDRLSYFSQEDYVDNIYYRFSTFQKLTCLISLSPKVHNKSYNYSRFFLNKQFNKLSIANTLK